MFFVKSAAVWKAMLLICACGLCSPLWALKVVSLSPAVTELICYLGKKDVLSGRSSACNYPREVNSLPVMGDFARPAVTRILALKPDFVITNELIVPGAARTFERAGIKLLYLPCRSLSDYRQMVKSIGDAVGAEKAAQQENRRLDDFVRSYRQKNGLNKKVLCLIWHHPVVVAGEKTLLHELVTLAGGENCRFNGVRGFFKPSARFLMECNADLLVVFSPLEGYKKHPVIKKMPQVRRGKIFVFPFPDALQRPGPRLTRGVEELRKILEK